MPALAILGGAVGFFAFVALNAMWNGYVLTILWAWFVVPTFHLPQLAIAPAIGISMIVKYLTHQNDFEKGDREWEDQVVRVLFYAAFYPLMVLGFGWIVHSFM